MTNIREILRLSYNGLSQRSIAQSCSCSRNTVSDVLHRAKLAGLNWPVPDGMSDQELRRLLYPQQQALSQRREPDCEYIHKELAREGVTLSLLWHEYCASCRQDGDVPLMYTQYCERYRKYALKTKATMHIDRKPGQMLEVDWAGQKAHVIDRITGEVLDANLFVAVLSSSKYTYVKAFPDQSQESWIAAHIAAFEFFGGVPRILVPDNLKTGVDKITKGGPILNKIYAEMAEHYNTAIVPARVKRPKDKPNAEGGVGVISTWIVAALRNRQFFSFQDLNLAISEKLEDYNAKPFQKIPASRLSTFLSEERNALQPLPMSAYEFSIRKKATVQFNYHISVESMNYSVPYELLKQEVDVRITKNIVEVLFNNQRVCSHPRLYGRPGQYSTLPDHMPEKHKQYLEWDSVRFLSWAASIGPNTEIVVNAILSSYKVEQQAYKSCFGLLKLADKYSALRLENACIRALKYTTRPGYKNIESILKTGQDKLTNAELKQPATDSPQGYVRGADYYRRDTSC